MSKKHPIAILEVLIALSLVLLCLAPLTRQPIELIRNKAKQLKKVECDRLAAWTFTEIKENFISPEMLWERIPDLDKTSTETTLPPLSIRQGSVPKERSFTIKTCKEKQEKNGRIYRLLSVNLKIDQFPFTYPLIVVKTTIKPD